MGLPQHVECDHCGYVNDDETNSIESGSSRAWVCPACNICNTTWHSDIGFLTKLGYQRDLLVGFL